MAPLPNRIEATAESLVARATDLASEALGWSARLGERGRSLARDEGLALVTTLASALRVGASEGIAAAVKRMRSTFVERGGCTRDLTGLLAFLEDELSARASEGADEQNELHDLTNEAIAALLYPSKPAQVLQLASDEIIAGAWSRLGEPRGLSPRDLTFLLSYIGDAMAEGSTGALAGHLRWLDTAHATDGLDAIIAAHALIDTVAALHGDIPELHRVIDAACASPTAA